MHLNWNLFYKLLLIFGLTYGSLSYAAIGLQASAAELGSLKITDKNGKSVLMTESQILSLPKNSIKTSTAWTEGIHLFEGTQFQTVLEKAGIDVSQPQGSTITAIAFNEYQVDLPLKDLLDYNVLVAAFMDGQRLSIRDKGPYWLIYPREDHPELQDPRFDHRWVWQLKELQIK